MNLALQTLDTDGIRHHVPLTMGPSQAASKLIVTYLATCRTEGSKASAAALT